MQFNICLIMHKPILFSGADLVGLNQHSGFTLLQLYLLLHKWINRSRCVVRRGDLHLYAATQISHIH